MFRTLPDAVVSTFTITCYSATAPEDAVNVDDIDAFEMQPSGALRILSALYLNAKVRKRPFNV